MRLSFDINPTSFSIGVPPVWTDYVFLVDSLDNFLVDETDDKLIAPEE